VNNTIGLFGTCGGSKWRDKFIQEYDKRHIDWFNPDAGDNWHPGMVKDENRHLKEDNIILFPVTDETLGVGSLGEIGFSILNVIRSIDNGSSQQLIIMIDDECNDPIASESEKKTSCRTRTLVKSKALDVNHSNIFVVQDLQHMFDLSIDLFYMVEQYKSIVSTFTLRSKQA
jgi:hypothetical protein